MINTVILMGRLCGNVDLRVTNSDLSVATAQIAVDRRYQKQGAERQADFIPVVAWRQQAEFLAKYFSKGDMVAIEGTLQSRNYEDKNGNKRTAYEVVADRISFCGGKRETDKGQTSMQAAPQQVPEVGAPLFSAESGSDDDLPF